MEAGGNTDGSPLRILVAGQEDVSGYRTRPSRNSNLLFELDRRFHLVGSIRPDLTRLQSFAARLRYPYPNRMGWRQRAGLNAWAFRRLTAESERQLEQREADYDVILMLQTLFSPSSDAERLPYTIYTDNIHTLTARHAPQWAPFNARQRSARIALEAATCRQAARIFAMSRFVRAALIDDYGCAAERVIHVGAGANSIANSIEPKRYDSRIALFVGINFELKGGSVLLRAWEQVRRQMPDAELWVVGPTPQAKQAKAEGVRWLGFVKERTELARIYDEASLFVLPSFYDAYPHALREAMGHGLPCVGTSAGGVPENIHVGETGLLVEPGAPEPLADAIISILGDPEKARAMGHAGYEEVRREHTWERVGERMAPHLEATARERPL